MNAQRTDWESPVVPVRETMGWRRGAGLGWGPRFVLMGAHQHLPSSYGELVGQRMQSVLSLQDKWELTWLSYLMEPGPSHTAYKVVHTLGLTLTLLLAS